MDDDWFGLKTSEAVHNLDAVRKGSACVDNASFDVSQSGFWKNLEPDFMNAIVCQYEGAAKNLLQVASALFNEAMIDPEKG